MRAQFVLSEILIGLRRNLTMTVALVVTMMISMAFLGGALLAGKEVQEAKGFWYGKIEVSVFLCGSTSSSPSCGGKDVTEDQRNQIQRDLEALPQVEKVYYESKQQAFERFKQEFKESKNLIQNVSPDALPESFRVKLKDPRQFEVVASAFRDRAGVDTVQDQKKVLQPIFKIFNGGSLTAYVLAIVQLAAATLLISNTIRVSAFSRRRETGIMRLVGASNLYIQLPFLLEGALAGLVGSALGFGLLCLGKWGLIDHVLRNTIKFLPWVGWPEVFGTLVWLIPTSLGISLLASFLTLRRHLRV